MCRQRISADRIYNAGCRIEPDRLGRNLTALLRIGAVVWVPGHTNASGNSHELPAPAETVKKPNVVLITRHDDPVLNWQSTLSNMVQKCDGNAAMARDLLDGNVEARELQKRAIRVACDREARRRGVVSVTPEQAGV
jgi:hypothetical protein